VREIHTFSYNARGKSEECLDLVGFSATGDLARTEVLLRSLAARQHRPTNNEWETGLISFDWVRLNAPTRLTRDGDTTPAAVRRISWFFEVGGPAGMKAGPFSQKTMRNYPKLSWKSTTYDAWPALPIDLNRTAGGFATAPFRPLTSYPKFQ